MSTSNRLVVEKTIKLYVGGRFIRSESGRVDRVRSSFSTNEIYVSRASRKDFRDAMEIARKAQAGWAGRTGYNRGQILYRLAEMIESRASAFPGETDRTQIAVDRAVHHAGWSDKISALLSTLNPVAAAYVNYSMIRPVGVVVAVPNPVEGLVGMVEAACAAAVMGNAVIVLVPSDQGELAAGLAEALATCDMPAGVVNVMTTDVPALLEWVNRHDDLDALYLVEGAVDEDAITEAQKQAARVMRRVVVVGSADQAAPPLTLQRLAEVKTVWMSS